MEEVIKRLAKWANGKTSPPETVQIYPTNRCNLKCLFCYQQLQAYDKADMVTKGRWLEIAEELCGLGVKNILISGGGEPLTVESVTIPMMSIFKKHSLKGRMIHNGVLWKEETIKEVIKIGWDNLIFSIDGPDAKTHDRLRGVKGAFNKALKNIKLFNKIKKDLKTDKPTIETTTVLCNKNYNSVLDIIRLAGSLEIKHLTFEPVCINNPGVTKLKLSEDQRVYFIEQIIPKALELEKKLGIQTNLPSLIKVKYIEKAGDMKGVILENNSKQHTFCNAPCFEPWIWPKIEANGEVWPCSTTPLKENIKKKSFSEIWYGNTFNNFRKNILEGKLYDSCANCVTTHIPVNRSISKQLKEVLGD